MQLFIISTLEISPMILIEIVEVIVDIDRPHSEGSRAVFANCCILYVGHIVCYFLRARVLVSVDDFNNIVDACSEMVPMGIKWCS